MHFNKLFNLALLIVAPCLTEAHVPHGKKCCDKKCYKRLEYADSHDLGNASKDCSSYQITTVTPCPTTVTSYSTATVTTTVCNTHYKKRSDFDERDGVAARNSPPKCTPTVSKNKQPKYADYYCKGEDWASACLCLGVYPTTTTLPTPTITKIKDAGTTTITKTKCSTTTTTSHYPQPTTCNAEQTKFCTSQKPNICKCLLDTDGKTPICSNGGACPQSSYPKVLPPCKSDADCAFQYPNSPYKRCVYTDAPSFCTPTYCASEKGCAQQHSYPGQKKREAEAVVDQVWAA